MLRRHEPPCNIHGCGVCLDDHLALADELERQTSTQNERVDILCEYRQWLDREGIPAEGEDGWCTEQAFDDRNIAAFAKARALAKEAK